MKKVLTLALAMMLLSACATETTTEATEAPVATEAVETTEAVTEATEAATEAETEAAKKDTYGPEEEWVVDGQWKLVVHSAEAVEYRNEFEETDPAEVVKITFSYENLGFEDDVQDLFLTPSSAIDANGNMGAFYPGNVETYVQPTPVGAKMNNAEEFFGLETVGDTIKVIFDTYDGNLNRQQATFELPITK